MAQLRAKSVWILHLCCLGSSNSESLIGPQFVAASSACTPGARAKNCLFVCRCEWFGWSLRGGKYPRFIQACSHSHFSNDHVQNQDSPMDFERAARIISLCHLPFNELLYPHTQLVHSRLAASFQRGRFRHWGITGRLTRWLPCRECRCLVHPPNSQPKNVMIRNGKFTNTTFVVFTWIQIIP